MTRLPLFALSVAASFAAAALADSAAVSGIQTADMDTSVRPQDDFFQYANGTWLRQVQIPNDRSRYGVDTMMVERSLIQQRELIEAARQSNDVEARKVGDLYSSFMDEARVEQQGIKPIQPELERIAAVNSVHDLSALMAHFDRVGLHSPFSTFVDVDAKRSTQYALWLEQSGLGMPNRDYYLSADAKFAHFRAQYLKHIEKMLALLGEADSGGAEAPLPKSKYPVVAIYTQEFDAVLKRVADAGFGYRDVATGRPDLRIIVAKDPAANAVEIIRRPPVAAP